MKRVRKCIKSNLQITKCEGGGRGALSKIKVAQNCLKTHFDFGILKMQRNFEN